LPFGQKLQKLHWQEDALGKAVHMKAIHPKRWQFQEAKAKLSQVVDDTLDTGPQIITRHGKDVAALIAIEDLPKVLAPWGNDENRKGAVLDMLLRAPKVDLKIRRPKDFPRPGPFLG
jgi:prevent-host-death family protein